MNILRKDLANADTCRAGSKIADGYGAFKYVKVIPWGSMTVNSIYIGPQSL